MTPMVTYTPTPRQRKMKKERTRYRQGVTVDLLAVAEVKEFLSGLQPAERQMLVRDNRHVFKFIVFGRHPDFRLGRDSTACPGKIMKLMWATRVKKWMLVAGSSRLGSVYEVMLDGNQKMPPPSLCVKFVKGVLDRIPHPVPNMQYSRLARWKKKMHLSEIHSRVLSPRRKHPCRS